MTAANLIIVCLSYNRLMIELELLSLKDRLRFKSIENRTHLWDIVRKKWIRVAPEELVRQLLIHHLILHESYPKGLIKVEKKLKVHQLVKRCDVLVLDKQGSPFLLIECKAPHINISQSVFDQVAMYNISLEVPYLLVSNGSQTFCCLMNYQNKSYQYIKRIPEFIFE